MRASCDQSTTSDFASKRERLNIVIVLPGTTQGTVTAVSLATSAHQLYDDSDSKERQVPSPSKAVVLRLTLVGLLLLSSAGFAAAQSREQGVIPDAARSPGEGVVFGILEASSYDSKGVKHSAESGPNIRYTITFGPASSLAEQHFTFFAASVAADRVLYGETKVPEVFFAKKMIAGTYYIYEVSRTTPAGAGKVLLAARFTVAPDKATYIGSIQVEFHGAKGVFGDERSGQRASIGVTDDFDKAALQYKERNPHLPLELAIGLMTIGK